MPSYIEIIYNAEHYIKQLETRDKILIEEDDILPSDNLIDRKDKLHGYYDVVSFTLNRKKIDTEDLLPGYTIVSGDFHKGVGYLIKRLKSDQFR
ncbi:MAG: hypothetical protein ACOVRN_10415 [Flavobacterium sp.]